MRRRRRKKKESYIYAAVSAYIEDAHEIRREYKFARVTFI